MSLEVKLGMIGSAGVGEEFQSYLKKEVEEQEVLKSIVTVVAAIMTTGKLEVAILKETTEIKHEILPLKEDMEKETVVITEREIKDQVHQFDIREGMTSLSVMKEERNEE